MLNTSTRPKGVYAVEPRLSGPCLSGTSIIRHGLPTEKGVGLSTAHVQSQIANEKGAGLPTAHVQSHTANTLADSAKFLSCLNSLCRHSNRQRQLV